MKPVPIKPRAPVFVRPSPRPSVVAMAWALMDAASKKQKPESQGRKSPVLARPKDNAARSDPYLRLVAARACKKCGKQGRSQAAHVPTDGKAIKQDDRETFPLCCTGPDGEGCHPKYDSYQFGERAKTVQMGKRWAAQTRAEIEAEGLWPARLAKFKPKRK